MLNRLINTTMAFALAILSGIVVADDTDIFLGKNSVGASGIEPSNLFFLLDTSSSMSWLPTTDPGNTTIKMDIMKQAMEDILSIKGVDNTLRNFNIGFGTFYRPGAVIDYPIRPIDGAGFNGDIVRNEITDSVNALTWDDTWGTPLASAYYEALAYWLQRPVLFGVQARDWADLVDNGVRGERLSSPTTFDASTTPPVYDFDGIVNQSCATNSILLLSDGQATTGEGYQFMLDNDPLIMGAMPTDAKDAQACDNTWGSPERCGRELADYAFRRLDTTDPNAPPIFTHTIGFDIPVDSIAEDYLQDVAAAGGGTYTRAANKDDLIDAFLDVANRVAETTSAFSAPAVTINTDNRLYSSPEIYINLFNTTRKPIWAGNVKKFEICLPSDTGCDPGQYLGNNRQVATDNDGSLLQDNVGDVWDDSADPSAADVLSGGLASKIGDWQSRNVYTWTAPDYPTVVDDNGAPSGRGWPMYRVDHTKEVLNGGTEPDLSDTTDNAGSDGRLRKRLHQRFGHCNAAGSIDSDCMDTLVSFMLGAKTRDEQLEGSDSANRWPIADVMHSEIITIPFGKNAAGESINKIAFGTNDGALHLHDAKTGAEEFVIYPQEVLDELVSLESAENGSEHIYGLDGSPTIRLRDADGDFVIEPADGDFVHLYIGMRRGGYHYYAYNLTPDAPLTNHTDTIGDPELLWKISGTTDATDPFVRLGQSWSRPKYARIAYGSDTSYVAKPVLIFGGGYDPDVEDVEGSFGPNTASGSNLGNAIYIVDADTGETIWWASSDYSAASGVPGLAVTDMHTSIVGDINTVDADNDRIVDRLYAADLSGQVWRVDLHPNLTDNSVGRLAAIGQSGNPADATDNQNERKFFYEPDFIRVRDAQFGGTGQGNDSYDVVAVVSGNRANPIDSSVDNRAYVFRDYLDDGKMLPLGSASPTNYPACNANSSTGCSVANSITNDGLYDISNVMIDAGSSTLSDSVIQALSSSNGYYFNLINDGEIGFSKTQVLAGKLYFSTYDPAEGPTVREENVDGSVRCVVDLGESNLYVVDLVTGNAIIPGGSDTTPGDRALFIGHHPVTNAVPMVRPSSQGHSVLEGQFQSGNSLPPDPDVTDLTFYPTFWYQE